MSALLQADVSARARAHPDARALVFRGEHLTYGALEEASNRLSRLLVEAGCCRGDRVGLLMPKIPMAIVAMLAVLKADAIYVPLDPAGPAARLARMLEAAECRCILAAGSGIAPLLHDTLAAAALRDRPLLGWLDAQAPAEADLRPSFFAADADACPAVAPHAANTDADIAHILFTSGSTGTPKGVMITHRSVMRFLRWARSYFGISPSDRISQHPPLHFDLSTFDIFGTLGAGAELHLVPPEFNLLPHRLAQFMRESRLTQWFSVPSVLNLMAKYGVLRQDDLPDLRRVLWCGEAIPTPTLMHWMRRLPHAQFTNLYGPTEATIASSYYTVPHCPEDERAPVPIGSACEGEELMVLDRALQPVRTGQIGDLYIRGAGLSPGYWRDPDKTGGAFLPFPGGAGAEDRIYRTGDRAWQSEDGLFHYIGRDNSQIKSRGYRIELGEIETALLSLPGLQEGAIVAIPSTGFEGWLICCAYVPAPEGSASPAALRAGMAAQLPGYMLPARWMRYETLPRNGNGKVDRPQLRSAFVEAETRDAQPPVAAPAQARG